MEKRGRIEREDGVRSSRGEGRGKRREERGERGEGERGEGRGERGEGRGERRGEEGRGGERRGEEGRGGEEDGRGYLLVLELHYFLPLLYASKTIMRKLITEWRRDG